MDLNWIVLAIDDEISRLQQAKALLNSASSSNPRRTRKVQQRAVATAVSKATSFNPAEFDF